MTKKETSATAPITVTKVSSEHMTSGISAVLTLPCSAPIRWSALYSLLSNSIKPEYAKPVKKCACTDNAAMIGVAAYYEYKKGVRHGWDLNAVPNLKLGER